MGLGAGSYRVTRLDQHDHSPFRFTDRPPRIQPPPICVGCTSSEPAAIALEHGDG
jgi:alkanesulfonate monooxygenase SsuD/methylene tetrahydromethanopterin reductase-like flavin-dependent oxidoreductase (luciferase family)